ncbi:PAP2-domain-containing protein [Hesseltinella vesiculosa]|uniref:PAP2-domain-containing protein n=1 Tax=Hesseltinella vesiculosa TaxID=101127 RepID=A0A1X2GCR2_9FUNG|nr:PAP2-domain-containing protein [Hesseltinella vesiculosa]
MKKGEIPPILAERLKNVSLYDLQYVFLGSLLLMDYIIIQTPGMIVKTVLGIALASSFFIPFVRRFTLPALPIFTWLITFYACQFIPTEYRPSHIFVNLLPSLERILYGASLSEIISKHTHPILDVLAWLPYGVIHFSLPFVFAFLLFVFGPPGSCNVFGKAFGYMNIAGVLTQLLFPNASPWYEMSYGSAPADYSIHGEAGGLARIDDILGLKLYGSTFGNSPLVFGAFPSLHSGSATIEMLFVTYLCPKLWPVAVAYTMWMWWSTMYLTHHYMIDLVGGSIYAFLTFFVARQFLPKVEPEKPHRLAYFGIQHLTISNLWRSIEYSMHFGGQRKADEEVALKEYDLMHGVTLTLDDGQLQDVYVLTEPDLDQHQQQQQVGKLTKQRPQPLQPIRMRRVDSYENDDADSVPYLSPHSTPTTSEPTSPVTPYSPVDLRHWKN